MARFTFQGPGGQKRTVEGPDGATEEQAFAELNRLLGEEKSQRTAAGEADMQRMADPTAGMGNLEKFTVGAGAATDRALRGVRGLTNKINGGEFTKTLEQGAEDADVYQRHHPGGAATAGEIAGDVAISSLPLIGQGGRLLKAANVARTIPVVGRALPAVADIGYNAAFSAATAPGERGKAALLGGAGATAGRVLNRAVGGLVRPSAPAQELLDQGVRLTPGQAGEGLMGNAAKGYERILQATPIAGSIMDKAKSKGLSDWGELMASKASRTSGEAMESTAIRFSRKTMDGVEEFTDHLADGVAPTSRQKFLQVTGKINGALQEVPTASHWHEIVNNQLDTAMAAARRSGDDSLHSALKEYSDNLGNILEINLPDRAKAIAEQSSKSRMASALERAKTQPSTVRRQGNIHPEELGVAAKGDPEIMAEALRGQKVFGRSNSDVDRAVNRVGKFATTGLHSVLGKATIPVAAASLLGTTEAGRRLILGQTSWQAFVRAHPKLASQVLRASATKAGQGEQDAP